MEYSNDDYAISIFYSKFINVFPNSAIQITNNVASEVKICLFELCRNDIGNGGAISFAASKAFLVIDTCFSKCFTTNSKDFTNLGQAINIQNSPSSSINSSNFDQCPSKEVFNSDGHNNNAVVNSISAKVAMKGSNITRARCHDGTALAAFYSNSAFNCEKIIIHECIATRLGILRAQESAINIKDSIISHNVGVFFGTTTGKYYISNCWLSENENMNSQQGVTTTDINNADGFQFNNYIECKAFVNNLYNRLVTGNCKRRMLSQIMGVYFVNIFLKYFNLIKSIFPLFTVKHSISFYSEPFYMRLRNSAVVCCKYFRTVLSNFRRILLTR